MVENVSARMVVNRVALKVKGERIRALIEGVGKELERQKAAQAE